MRVSRPIFRCGLRRDARELGFHFRASVLIEDAGTGVRLELCLPPAIFEDLAESVLGNSGIQLRIIHDLLEVLTDLADVLFRTHLHLVGVVVDDCCLILSD